GLPDTRQRGIAAKKICGRITFVHHVIEIDFQADLRPIGPASAGFDESQSFLKAFSQGIRISAANRPQALLCLPFDVGNCFGELLTSGTHAWGHYGELCDLDNSFSRIRKSKRIIARWARWFAGHRSANTVCGSEFGVGRSAF